MLHDGRRHKIQSEQTGYQCEYTKVVFLVETAHSCSLPIIELDTQYMDHGGREKGVNVTGSTYSLIVTTMSSSKGEGRREEALAKQRDQMREEFERQKKTLISETEKARPSVNRFVGQHDSVEETLKHSTVGLVHLEEFQQKRKELEEAKAREAAKTSELKYVLPSYLILPLLFLSLRHTSKGGL